MKAKIIKILVGIMLIALGAISLADKLGYVELDLITRQVWSIIFALASATFFTCYFLDGVRKWGWLFPSLISAALALVVGVLVDYDAGSMIPMTILLSVGIPFYVGYFMDRKQWGLLIPAWIMTVICAILILSESTNSDLIASLFLYAIALPFIVAYLLDRQRKWSLIVGIVLAIIGLLPLLASILPADIEGTVVMFLFALPFIIVYFATKNSWWAIIPAGVFASIGVVALLANLLPNNTYYSVGGLDFGVYTCVLFLGFAITFGILWLLRGSQPTAWAKYPAIGLLLLSILAFLLWNTASNLVIAIALLVIGVAIIIGSVLKPRNPQQLNSRQL